MIIGISSWSLWSFKSWGLKDPNYFMIWERLNQTVEKWNSREGVNLNQGDFWNKDITVLLFLIIFNYFLEEWECGNYYNYKRWARKERRKNLLRCRSRARSHTMKAQWITECVTSSELQFANCLKSEISKWLILVDSLISAIWRYAALIHAWYPKHLKMEDDFQRLKNILPLMSLLTKCHPLHQWHLWEENHYSCIWTRLKYILRMK